MKKLYFIALCLYGVFANAQVTVNIPLPNSICNPGDCVLLTANYSTVNSTSDYTVAAIPYSPPFPFTGGTVLNNVEDDVWSPQVTLPFDFNFYGNTYNKLLVGSNGVITFDIASFGGGVLCPWDFSATIPSTTFPVKNAIYGVYQDTDIKPASLTNPAIQNVNYYVLNTGINAAPNRVFVINFNELPAFAPLCTGAGLQTSQVVIYEGSNKIDVYVQRRNSCPAWNDGSGVIGIQNATGTMAVTPAGRNTGTWSTTNEAWRFSPSGTALSPTFIWSINGVFVPSATGSTYTACPTETTTYGVTLHYDGINDVSDEITITPTPLLLADPDNLIVCATAPPYTVDMSSNTELVLNGQAPNDFIVTYYDNYEDAINGVTAHIDNLENYSFTENQTIYMRVEDVVSTGCVSIKSFTLTGNPPPAPPTGVTVQNFIPGQTLADLVVNGQNILWYDAAVDGNLLPSTTILVDGVTYFASQNVGGCESRVAASRLAITVVSVLSNTSFSKANFKLYPNPANNVLTVSFSRNIDQIAVYNLLGQIVLNKNESQKEVKLDISALNSGTYFIKVTSGNESTTNKFIKK